MTGRAYDRLVARYTSSRIFKDVDSIPFGVDFRGHISDSVGKASVLLAVIGKHWLTATDAAGKRRLDKERDFVRLEIEAALERDIPVVPFLVHGTTMPAAKDLPESLRTLAYRNGLPVRPDPDLHSDMDRLIQGLGRYLR